jgi:hypothetical protein
MPGEASLMLNKPWLRRGMPALQGGSERRRLRTNVGDGR